MFQNQFIFRYLRSGTVTAAAITQQVAYSTMA